MALLICLAASGSGQNGCSWQSLSLSLHVIFHQSVVWPGAFNILDEPQETEKESCKVSKGLDPEVTEYCSWNILLVKASGRTSLDP